MNYDVHRLVGRTITAIYWMGSHEAIANGWRHRAPVFTLDDGTEFYPQAFSDAGGLGIHDETYHLVAPKNINSALAREQAA